MQEFTTELNGAFSIKPGLLVSNRKNPEKGREKRRGAEHQNYGAFEAEESRNSHRTSMAEEGSRTATELLLHNWQLLSIGLPHSHHSIGSERLSL